MFVNLLATCSFNFDQKNPPCFQRIMMYNVESINTQESYENNNSNFLMNRRVRSSFLK